jgi:diguanylate cyclase (GGDEF)-like protein
MTTYFSAALVLIGLIIHISTLAPLRSLIGQLPIGSLRNAWRMMAVLIFMFIAGYFGYLMLLWEKISLLGQLIIPCIFLFGAIFVRLTIKLALQTATDLQRIVSLETENITDPLTKVYNRRYLDRRLDDEIVRAKRYSFDLSILMLDADHFKRINDVYGHQAGDTTLSTLSNLVQNALRDLDVVARYGGEEFLVICTNTTANDAELVAERLRKLIESNPIKLAEDANGEQTVQITISVGVASLSTRLDDKAKLIAAADECLYLAKESGRNRVVVAAA